MRRYPAKRGLRTGLLLACVLAVGMSLSACTDLDNMFGDNGDISQAPPPMPAKQAPAGQASAGQAAPTASSGLAAPAAPTAQAPTAGGNTIAPVATITPVTIQPGPDTGTQVNKTIQSLRARVSGLESKLMANAQRLAALRNSGATAAASYQDATAQIVTRLQMGTTKGNPHLVSQWNIAQAALDRLSTNINQLSALGTAVTNDSSSAHFALDQIDATFNVSGAVDEDHRQLTLLEDETNQTVVLIDRLLTEISADIQRQTAYVANERSSLTVLASSIRDGELYGGTPGLSAATAAAGATQFAATGTPLVVVRFDHRHVNYQQILYAALNQALKAQPNASFQVVGVAPTRGNAAAVQIAQTAARRHAQDVMRTMTDMGVPASRLNVASATDPAASSSEVRVFVR